jgi:hypothetical protein
MPDIAKERRRLPVVLSLFLDILATALLVFLVYYTVYELPAAYPDSPVMASVNPNSQKLHLSISSTEKGATSKVPNHPDTSAPAADSPSDAADWKTKLLIILHRRLCRPPPPIQVPICPWNITSKRWAAEITP